MAHRRRPLGLALFIVAALALVSLAAACNDDDVGVPCDRDLTEVDPGQQSSSGAVLINAQALSCRSRLCIRYRPEASALCTTPCESADDCPGITETCETGFACVVGQAIEGGLRCCKLCVCKDFLPDPEHDQHAAACAGQPVTCPNI